MTQIFIDNQQVNLNTDQTFEYNTENPLFTKSSEYSGDLTLSLLDATNAKIFKSVNRMEVKKETVSLPVRLVIDDETIVSGSAKVIEITNTDITLQILGGNAYVNNKSWEEELFIDELNLGRAYEGLRYRTTGLLPGEYDVMNCEGLTLWAMQNNDATVASKFFNTIENEDCVVLPAESSQQDDYPSVPLSLDQLVIMTYKDSDNKSEFVNIPGKLRLNDEWVTQYPTTYIYAVRPQPYLVVIVEKVISALGFTIQHSDLRNDWTKRIYIPNVRKTLYYKEMLPHWSVNRFLTEIENFLGVVFYFDTKSNTCDIVERDSASVETYHLDLVEDHYAVQTEEGSESDITHNNIAYADMDSNIEQVPEEIEDAAKKITFTRFADLLAWFRDENVKEEEKMQTIAIYKNRQFAYWDDTFIEINHYRKLLRSKDVETIALSIVPAKLSNAQLDLRKEILGTDLSLTLRLEPIETVTNPIFPVPYVNMGGNIVDNSGGLNIQEAIVNGGLKNTKENFEILPVAIADFDENTANIRLEEGDAGTAIKYRFGYTHGGDASNNVKSPNLRLYPMEDATTLYDHSFNKRSVSVNMAHEFTFFDNGRFDPRSIFIIRGKKYLCQNIQYSIDNKGFAQKKIGTFYPIE